MADDDPPDDKPARVLQFRMLTPVAGMTAPYKMEINPRDCDSLIEAYYMALRGAQAYAKQTLSLAQALLIGRPVENIADVQRVAEWAKADAEQLEHNIQAIEPFRREGE